MQAAYGNAGLGLGLGLPSTFKRNTRSISAATVTQQQGINDDFLFPLAPHSRKFSAETIQISNDLVSYWSPMTDDGGEWNDSENEQDEEEADFHQEADSPESETICTPDSRQPASPQRLAAHACLHMLSPKMEALAKAAAAQGVSTEEALCTAMEWAWLVPMVGKSDLTKFDDASSRY